MIHNHEVGGSIPPLATTKFNPAPGLWPGIFLRLRPEKSSLFEGMSLKKINPGETGVQG
jgi:hypothetical protein